MSAPFPLSVLNIPLGSIVLAAKSEKLNWYLLQLYFFPVMIVTFCLFMAYQCVMLPFCYVKMSGHKWALAIKAPAGEGSITALDRAGAAFIFMIFGPLFLLAAALADSFWYILHVYKTDLDKTEYEVAKKEDQVTLHRRSYKKMLTYFEK